MPQPEVAVVHDAAARSPQVTPSATHAPPTQQPATHVESSQHGWPVPPHAFDIPLLQTIPLAAVGFVPEAKQAVPVPQQPPAAQVVPPQHGCPTPPHAVQAPLEQLLPPVHIESLAMQVLLPGSQQPPEPQVAFAQQT